MLVLTGNNLGEKQKDLNMKVNEAALNKVDFEQIKNSTEQSDVDMLYKIDLASSYMNIEYIIEVLKSGDPLHISRALKCSWLYEDCFSDFINTDYLHQNVFPYMSLKMKKKLLTSISTNLKNVDRAMAFYNYCMNMKLTNIAWKFLLFNSLPDDFKMDFLKQNSMLVIQLEDKKNFKQFIGSSFTLADALLATPYWASRKLEVLVSKISYLYTVSNVNYLDMLEKRVEHRTCTQNNCRRLGLRLSKDIITKHKNRVNAKPSLYLNLLNKSSIVRYTNQENAKLYIIALIPEDVNKFWNDDVFGSYEYIINILPAEDRFGFIKDVFSDKYPHEPFEMDIKFYSRKYYKFMTTEQKHKWALDHIATQKEILGIGNDFKWYVFVNFEKAFDDIKKLIMITTDTDKRNNMNNILVESAKTQRDLEKLFKYYYERHNNEQRFTKERFVDWVACNHNVYEFDRNCWEAFNKIYQNLDVYSMLDYCRPQSEHKVIALIYHIIHEIDMHEALKLFIDVGLPLYVLRKHREKLSKDKQDMVYEYLLKFYLDKIDELTAGIYNDDVKRKLRKYIHNTLDLLNDNRKKRTDIPEVVNKFMKLDWDEFYRHHLLYEPPKRLTQDELIRLLKKDAKLVVESLPLVKQNIECLINFNLGLFLRKLKVYFPHDIAKDYLNFYNQILSTKIGPISARAACFGVFNLAENNSIIDFMIKYAPTQNKINRSEIDESLMNIQEAICATAFYSRPPVPLKNMMMYVKGDYVPKCLSMFNHYSANLPLPLCMEFIEAILNNPVSIQKHGLRLAFAYFNADNLKNLILNVWKRTKNVSLRVIIYKALYNRILIEDENARTVLFETLLILTPELHQDDDNEIFTFWMSAKLPEPLISDYINTVWKTLCALPFNNMNQKRMTDVVRYIISNNRSLRQDLIQSIVDEFVNTALSTEDSIKAYLKCTDLNQSKWELTAVYITFMQNEVDLKNKLELTKVILTQCSNRFNLVDEKLYVMRRFLTDFLRNILRLSFTSTTESYEHLNVLLGSVLQILQALFSIEDIYMLMWAIRINIEARKALIDIKAKFCNIDDKADKRAIVRNSFLNLGENIRTIIEEFMTKKMYFKTFMSKIQTEFIFNTEILASSIQGFDIQSDDILVVASVPLTKIKIHEMYMYVLNVLPSHYSRQYEEDYNNVLEDLKGFDDLEIRCKIYDKFVNTDYEPRVFLQL